MEKKMRISSGNNPHAWFFAYVNGLNDYNIAYAKYIREGIVLQYSNGLTSSLAELYRAYPSAYNQMKYELLGEINNELDRARKRLIATIYTYLRGSVGVNTDYVKRVACQAAQVERYNDIRLNDLKRLCVIFTAKAKQ